MERNKNKSNKTNMKTTNTEPMVKYSNHVHTTTDYYLFKSIDGNRNKNLLHINRLKKSMQSNYLFTVIIVNEYYEIIDGQHIFEVIKELNLPLRYIICEGYGLNEVHLLNANSKTWNSDDYLEGYCNLGNKDYLIYKEFKQRYNFGHTECLTFLSGKASQQKTDKLKEFYEGKFKVVNYLEACNFADKIEIIGQYYAGYKRRSFIFAIYSLLNNKNFEFTEFIQKLKIQQGAIVDCVNSTQYVALIEEIYNYKRRDKVNLRY